MRTHRPREKHEYKNLSEFVNLHWKGKKQLLVNARWPFSFLNDNYFGRQKLEEYLWRCTAFSRSHDPIVVSIADGHRLSHHSSRVLPALVGTKGLDTW